MIEYLSHTVLHWSRLVAVMYTTVHTIKYHARTAAAKKWRSVSRKESTVTHCVVTITTESACVVLETCPGMDFCTSVKMKLSNFMRLSCYIFFEQQSGWMALWGTEYHLRRTRDWILHKWRFVLKNAICHACFSRSMGHKSLQNITIELDETLVFHIPWTPFAEN